MRTLKKSFALAIIFLGMWSLNTQAQNRLKVYNNGTTISSTTIAPTDRLHVGNEGHTNIRIGRYVALGITGGGLSTLLGNNVKASTTENNKMLFVNTTGDGGQAIKMQYNEGISFHTFSGATTANNEYVGHERMRIALNGNVGIGTQFPRTDAKLDVAGNIYMNGELVNASDARFKKDIQTISADAVARLGKVRGTTYQFRTEEFKKKNFTKGKQLGFIAQELKVLFPELVKQDSEGYYSVNYTGLIPVMVEAIKKQQQKINALEAANTKISAQLSKIQQLEQRLNALETTGNNTLNK